MSPIALKRLIAKKEARQVLGELFQAMNTPLGIQDVGGEWLLGMASGEAGGRYPIALDGKILGWVVGEGQAAAIANLLGYLAKREVERKELARETLEKYKEINLLYKISERIAATLELEDVAQLVLEEASKIINADSGSVMLLDPQTEQLYIIAAFGQENPIKTPLKFKQGIAGIVALTGRAEIVNDVTSDGRYLEGSNKVSSLICAPLKITDRAIGTINLSSQSPVQYTAADLKLLNALASQAAAAIENAILHKNKLKEERIKSNLERYVSDRVVRAIMDSTGEISLNPTKKNVAILFSDIRNFTTYCEELEPETIVQYLNEYFTHMVDVIFNHEGTVNKFVGDMIVAFFGAPSEVIDSEAKAIETAISMQKRLKTIPISWIAEHFNTGIGISSGRVVVGNIGSPSHMDYTAIGDEVNIASRLQSIAKGGQILVSRSIYKQTKKLFKFKEFGEISLKGKKNAIEVFEVLY
ncbi:adenylate/guanylate cyclase domain-containing protein [Lusitaniella coriacea]|uniref:adenylate/guanylate cyclase domain-containing protein n=1 Tax=Lusitaniella coriacea TaxID=1983105 RepID=UPI003CF5A848